MSMFDAAFHDIPCHNAIRVPQGYTVVCKNDITKKETVDMVVSWCGFLRPRWMFAYHIPDDATWHTRENVSYYLCCAAKWYKQKRFMMVYGSGICVFLVTILLFERRTTMSHAKICMSSLSTTCAVHESDNQQKADMNASWKERLLAMRKKTYGEGKCQNVWDRVEI